MSLADGGAFTIANVETGLVVSSPDQADDEDPCGVPIHCELGDPKHPRMVCSKVARSHRSVHITNIPLKAQQWQIVPHADTPNNYYIHSDLAAYICWADMDPTGVTLEAVRKVVWRIDSMQPDGRAVYRYATIFPLCLSFCSALKKVETFVASFNR